MKSKLKDRVEDVLRNEPETRNDDQLLTLCVWKLMFPEQFISIPGMEGLYIRAKSIISELPNHDYISRIRRKFQEAGQYEATDPEIRKKRKQEEKTWIDFSRTAQFNQ